MITISDLIHKMSYLGRKGCFITIENSTKEPDCFTIHLWKGEPWNDESGMLVSRQYPDSGDALHDLDAILDAMSAEWDREFAKKDCICEHCLHVNVCGLKKHNKEGLEECGYYEED